MKLNAIALALGLASSSAFAGTFITVDPDGTGSASAFDITTLDWAVGNTISTPVAPSTSLTPDQSGVIQTYGHSFLGGFYSAGSKITNDGGLGSNYNWTFVFGVRETATTFGNTTVFETASGGDNFFEVYYNSDRTAANMLNGTGFNGSSATSKLILSGTITSTDGNFTAKLDKNTGDLITENLDQTGFNNYPGQTSTKGQGSTTLEGVVEIGFADPDFFKGIGSQMILDLSTINRQAFEETDPSSCFWNGTSLIGGAGQNSTGTAPASCLNTIGTVNGISGPNIMFQTDASTAFVVPEPASLALVGAGLLSALGLRRKRA